MEQQSVFANEEKKNNLGHKYSLILDILEVNKWVHACVH